MIPTNGCHTNDSTTNQIEVTTASKIEITLEAKTIVTVNCRLPKSRKYISPSVTEQNVEDLNDESDFSSDETDEMEEIESYTNNKAQNNNATQEISCKINVVVR